MLVFLSLGSSFGQSTFTGRVIDRESKKGIAEAEIFIGGQEFKVDSLGQFSCEGLYKGHHELVIFTYDYKTLRTAVDLPISAPMLFELEHFNEALSEVVIRTKREENFALKRLKPIEGTAIYAGKKSEVVLLDQLVANTAANNARQIYGQVVGLNIYESNDGGLQLSIGGRGLNPNRTANFNTRQNGYDISADVLGYPESYYTPPAEALSEVQVVRGAASLQYGTQFGGLINFKLKKPNPHKKIEWLSRQTLGSFGLFTSFNSLSGTLGKFSYYTYFNYKTGNGYRENSDFDSENFYAFLNYKFSEKTELSFEITYLDYLAQQAGGLTDQMFVENPKQSNRTRNWFGVDWRLYALKFSHRFGEQTDFSLNIFGLDAERNALGFRGVPGNLNSNPISDLDEQNETGDFIYPRDLIKGTFNNWGMEGRVLHKYKIAGLDAAALFGAKLYKANNTSTQGAGSSGTGADFKFRNIDYPDYPNQSDFVYPNFNLAIFGEHIFHLGPKISLTPGLRFEQIRTESKGEYQQVVFDNAGNPIANRKLTDNQNLPRKFVLAGIGLEYKPNDLNSMYANISQNYRSVTFSDIRTVNPTFKIDPGIKDEKGFTADFGFRGNYKQKLSYDVGGFGLLYANRIGIVLDDRANRIRKNIGKAFIYGFESLIDWNIANTFLPSNYQTRLNWFVNLALTDSKYLESEERNVKGKKVEFIPLVNLKTGLRYGYKNLFLSAQWTYLSQQFTDVQNSRIPDEGDLKSGLVGEIPAYSILDISSSYSFKNVKLEAGLNNALNRAYFTRRATGYPGPGIIPSDGRAFYVTLQFRL